MSPRRRNLVVTAALALAAAMVAAFWWQPITGRLRPAPLPQELTLAIDDAYIGSGLVHIAAAQGYFAAEGLAVTLQAHTSGRNALDAVIANRADIATVADTPVMFAVMKGTPLSIIAGISSATRSNGIIARRDRGISLLADLKGKTIGVPVRAYPHFLLFAMLASHGIAPGAVSVADTKPEDMVAALSAAQVDAVAIWEPLLSKARAALGAQGVMFFPAETFNVEIYLTGRREYVQNHPLEMQKLLRALLRAERYLLQEPQAAYTIVANATKSGPALFSATWPKFTLSLTLSQTLLNTIEDQARWAISAGFTEAKEVPNFMQSIYLGAMLAVKPQAVTIVR